MKTTNEVTRRGTRRPALLMTALGAALFLTAGPATAQEPPRTDCRCVDRSGDEIDNCTCLVRPNVDELTRMWTMARPNRARIGVTVSAQQDATADREGTRIQEVLEGGPADEAGLREGDVIVRVNGRSLFEPLDDREAEGRLELEGSAPVQRLLALLAELEPGDEVELEYLRAGETHRTVVEAERNPARFGGALTLQGGEGARGFITNFRRDSLRSGVRGPLRVFGSMDPCFTSRSGESGSATVFHFGDDCVDGLELVMVNPELGEYFGVDEGVLVADVREGATLGLQPGDVLLAVDGREVEDVAHARRILRSYRPDEDVTLRIVRQGETMEVTGRRR